MGVYNNAEIEQIHNENKALKVEISEKNERIENLLDIKAELCKEYQRTIREVATLRKSLEVIVDELAKAQLLISNPQTEKND